MAWREAPYFTDAERAALALTEAATRMADRPESVTDAVWDEAADHFDEQGAVRDHPHGRAHELLQPDQRDGPGARGYDMVLNGRSVRGRRGVGALT